jgi:hypothetical protein
MEDGCINMMMDERSRQGGDCAARGYGAEQCFMAAEAKIRLTMELTYMNSIK